MLAACLLGIVMSGSDGAEPDSQLAADRPLVLRVHSLAGLVDAQGRTSATLSMLPYRIMSSQEGFDDSEESPPLLGSDVAAAVDIDAVYAPPPLYFYRVAGASCSGREGP